MSSSGRCKVVSIYEKYTFNGILFSRLSISKFSIDDSATFYGVLFSWSSISEFGVNV